MLPYVDDNHNLEKYKAKLESITTSLIDRHLQ